MDALRRAFLHLRLLGELIASRSTFATPYYREAELARLANLFAHVDLESWRGHRVLEVGAGPGRLGDALAHLGFEVTSSDGRPEHVERLRARGRNAFVLDLDDPALDLRGYDLILAFGVLYHLADPALFLRACAPAKVLLLETVVCDRRRPHLTTVRERRGWLGQDQALGGRGCRPSPAWVEAACREAGFTRVRDISSPIGNWINGIFDWQPEDSGAWQSAGRNFRKMWVVEA